MKLTDTHAHYDDDAFDSDRERLLTRLFEESVSKIITVGCAPKRWQPTIALTECFEGMYGALGLHPEDIADASGDWENLLKELLTRPKIKALGEIGLDYHYENYDREMQIKFFRRQIVLAKEMDLPIIIHSREATEDTMNILRELKPEKAVMHCFSGSPETAKELVAMGLYISFTGVLTFKNAKKAVSACEVIPTDRLMLETDCPYMSPVPFRGERCDSSMIQYTAAKMGEIKGFGAEEMIDICNKNADRFFGLGST
ncbi:MAG: TatD family hydrolase [Ruminiclostridium sp.]|nr:TatD family hydrolase [Ruminiclostridium sp.]